MVEDLDSYYMYLESFIIIIIQKIDLHDIKKILQLLKMLYIFWKCYDFDKHFTSKRSEV